MYKRLKITAKLKHNLIVNGAMYLDGILYSAMRREQLGEDYYNLPRMGEEAVGKIKLPIKRKNKVYLASQACYKVRLEYMDRWRKRWNELSVDEWGKLRRIYINQKTTKNYDMPVNVVVVKDNKVWWYCIGDEKRLEKLLEKCYYIGKEGGQGYGLVEEWEIEETKHKGVRVFPVIYEKGLPRDEIIVEESCNPPYSRRDKKVKCVIRKF